MDFDAAIQRKIDLKLSDSDLRLFSKAGSQRLSLEELDRLSELSRQSEIQPSALAFAVSEISAAVLGPEQTAPTAPDQPPGDLQGMTQTQLWELAQQQGAQRRAAKAKAQQPKRA